MITIRNIWGKHSYNFFLTKFSYFYFKRFEVSILNLKNFGVKSFSFLLLNCPRENI